MLLWTAGAVLLAAGALAVAAAALWPVADVAASAPVVAEAGLLPGVTAGLPPLPSFEAAWSRDLRQPLSDTDATAAAVSLSPGEPGIRLVGTIVDGGTRPRGIFVVGLASIELKAVGERAGGAEILRIDERSATLAYPDRQVTLKLEKLDALGVDDPPAGTEPPPTARSTARSATDQ